MIRRNNPALGYAEHAAAILLEPRITVQPSQPGDGVVRSSNRVGTLLIHDRARKASRAKTVNEQCGNAGASQVFRIVDLRAKRMPALDGVMRGTAGVGSGTK
jgi:hypothetical protein